jgi:hypothetical protein
MRGRRGEKKEEASLTCDFLEEVAGCINSNEYLSFAQVAFIRITFDTSTVYIGTLVELFCVVIFEKSAALSI